MSSSRSRVAGLFLLLFFVAGCFQNAMAIPAFARKYGLRCSACHEAWPKLNDFGWRFKDNGYQLMNDRDAPIWQNPGYWPITLRITPSWHRENVNKVSVDNGAADPTTGFFPQGEASITSHGFDNSGLDILTAGTLEKNITFLLVPSADSTASFHFESVWVRLDNLFKSPWINVRMGKFELDNFISEKRTYALSNNGGPYQLYHFSPVGDSNSFAQLGDNQLGLEWMGHSASDRTRVSAALFSSSDGSPNLVNANTYSGYFTASQAFDLGGLGLQRIGAYAMVGEAPTYSLTSQGIPVPGSSLGNKSFSREGVFADFYIKKFDVAMYYQHGSDDAHFGAATPANQPLVAGARNPTWNGAFIEPHYTVTPQLVLFQRSEWVRMSQQAIPGTPSNLGDIDAYTFGYRWYPIMTSRAGFAFHNEYSWVRARGMAPVTGGDLSSSSLFFGFDFDF